VPAEHQAALRAGPRAALWFRKRLFKICSSACRIDSPDKAREVPDLTQVAPEQAVRFLQCSFIVVAINDVRRPRNAPILTKLVHAINCHGAPEPNRQESTCAAERERGSVQDAFTLESPPTFHWSLSVNICGKYQAKVVATARRPKTFSSSTMVLTQFERAALQILKRRPDFVEA